MKNQSRRARRMERHHKMRKASPLNLVSLMDIFTILVFFLLVNSSNTQQLPSSKDITLPTSKTKNAPQETLIIAVTQSAILIQGRQVISVKELLRSDESEIPALAEELEFLTGGLASASEGGMSITIMGDENLPFDVMRRILNTCQQANFTNIAFAATQIVENS